MEKKIRVLKTIVAEETELGKDSVFFLEKTTPPIIRLLRESYLEDSESVEGDIDFLFKFDGEGMEEYEKLS